MIGRGEDHQRVFEVIIFRCERSGRGFGGGGIRVHRNIVAAGLRAVVRGCGWPGGAAPSEYNRNMTLTARDRARRIKILLFDVDGVLTDGSIWLVPGAPASGTVLDELAGKDGQIGGLRRLEIGEAAAEKTPILTA